VNIRNRNSFSVVFVCFYELGKLQRHTCVELMIINLLHCALAVYCNRSCLWVCGSVTAITRNCVHRSLPNWVCR